MAHIPTRAEVYGRGLLEFSDYKQAYNAAVDRLDEAERLLRELFGKYENEQYPPQIHAEVRRFLELDESGCALCGFVSGPTTKRCDEPGCPDPMRGLERVP